MSHSEESIPELESEFEDRSMEDMISEIGFGKDDPKTRDRKRRAHVFLAAIVLIFFGALLTFTPSISDFLRVSTYITLAFFFIYLIRHLSFAWAGLAARWLPPKGARAEGSYEPTVSVIVPAHNEELVIRKLVDRLMDLEYSREKYQVIVVDDASTDQTSEILRKLEKIYSRLKVIHRTPEERKRLAGKSPALNRGVIEATGEIVAVFDSDHIPEKDVLRRLMFHFADPEVGAVMGRCKVMNPDENVLTKLIYIDYLSGYLVNEFGREIIHNMPAYGGANCAVRKSLLFKLGGFSNESVTEDTELTTRVMLDGNRVVYDKTALDWEQAPRVLTTYWKQRYRWAYGHQHVFYDYWLEALKSEHLGLMGKIESLLFLFLFHMPILMFFGLFLLSFWALGIFVPADPFASTAIWVLMFLGPFSEMSAGIVAEWAEGESPPHPAYLILFPALFFISILVCTKAFLDGLIHAFSRRGYEWVVTER